MLSVIQHVYTHIYIYIYISIFSYTYYIYTDIYYIQYIYVYRNTLKYFRYGFLAHTHNTHTHRHRHFTSFKMSDMAAVLVQISSVGRECGAMTPLHERAIRRLLSLPVPKATWITRHISLTAKARSSCKDISK